MEPTKIDNDTICAVSTPSGVGGIAVVRVSGPQSIAIVNTVWRGKSLDTVESHTVHLGIVTDCHGDMLDQCVATVYRGPRSYTGDDVVELSVHGSRWIQRELIETLCKVGCRMAEAGEFTRRAFAAGNLDLAEAEGVADMIASSSRAAHRAAACQMRGHYSKHIALLREQLIELASLIELELDFSEEEVEFASRERLLNIATVLHQSVTKLCKSFSTGSVIKEGIPVAIIGPTNAGKSSLLNAIVGDERAIVSDIHGTTRDVVEDTIVINDYMYRLQDTAGLRNSEDVIEQIGIKRSIETLKNARIIIYTIDLNDYKDAMDDMRETVDLNHDADVIVALNKVDSVDDTRVRHVSSMVHERLPQSHIAIISTLRSETIDILKQLISNLTETKVEGDIIVTNARHAQALEQSAQSIERVITGLESGLSGDFIAQDIRETIHHLGTITGAVTTDTLLSTIFSRFCIGK